MSGKGNQMATATRRSIVNRFSRALRAWSVQGSNLRPPVNVSLPNLGPVSGSPYLIVANPLLQTRIAGESATSNGNRTAIRPEPPGLSLQLAALQYFGT